MRHTSLPVSVQLAGMNTLDFLTDFRHLVIASYRLPNYVVEVDLLTPSE